MSRLSEKIIRLRKKGMSFKAIAKAVPCSLGTVHYSLTEGAREKAVERNRNRRRANSARLKAAHGGACAVCGYDKCLEALEFDHLDPKTKLTTVSAVRAGNAATMEKEATKCLLLCCRCHRERHNGILDIGMYLEPDL